jgi:hypothetical protein
MRLDGRPTGNYSLFNPLIAAAHYGNNRANSTKNLLLPKRLGSCLKSRAAAPRRFILHRNSDFLGKVTLALIV